MKIAVMNADGSKMVINQAKRGYWSERGYERMGRKAEAEYLKEAGEELTVDQTAALDLADATPASDPPADPDNSGDQNDPDDDGSDDDDESGDDPEDED